MTLTILPPHKSSQPRQRPAIQCGHCQTLCLPSVRQVKTTDGEEGTVRLATCFNCGSVLIAEFVPEKGQSDGAAEEKV